MLQSFKRLYLWEKIIILVSLPMIFLFAFIIAFKGNIFDFSSSDPQVNEINLSLETTPRTQEDTIILDWKPYRIRANETVNAVFTRAGFDSSLLNDILANNPKIQEQLKQLKPSDNIEFGLGFNDEFQVLRFQSSPKDFIYITKTAQGYELSKKDISATPIFPVLEASIGVTDLSRTTDAMGLTEDQKISIADIFGWRINLIDDIKPGDYLKILFQQPYVDGAPFGEPEVAVATIINQGKSIHAIRNPDDGNYYDLKGEPMKRPFLRAPLSNYRITSNFSLSRRNPVTGRYIPHRGVDYAAPLRTPIWAIGNGVVIASSYNQYNGNYVFIQHNDKYITKYLHLSRRLVEKGDYVTKSTQIGTLGSTGRVTGAHLHYEFLVNGVHKDPVTVALPNYNSLVGIELSKFKIFAEEQLNLLSSK